MKLNSSAELTVSCDNTVSLDTHMNKLSSQHHCTEVKAALGLILQLSEEAVSGVAAVNLSLFL